MNRAAGGKAEKMNTKAQALEVMIDSCLLPNYTSPTNNVDAQGELQRMTVKSSVKGKLMKSRTLNVKKQKDESEVNEDKTQKQKTDEQEEPVVAE